MTSLKFVVFAVAVLVAGCGQRSLGSADRQPDPSDSGVSECETFWDCNPGVDCGELIQCVDGRCRPDLGHIIIPCAVAECETDDDCVVAAPENCCYGCPQVVPRSVWTLSPTHPRRQSSARWPRGSWSQKHYCVEHRHHRSCQKRPPSSGNRQSWCVQ